MLFVLTPKRSEGSLLVRIYPDFRVVPEVGRGAPQDGDRAPDLDVRRDALVLVEQRLFHLVSEHHVTVGRIPPQQVTFRHMRSQNVK